MRFVFINCWKRPYQRAFQQQQQQLKKPASRQFPTIYPFFNAKPSSVECRFMTLLIVNLIAD